MSSPATTSKTGATFLWVLGAFTIFAVLFAVIQTIAGNRGDVFDPRAAERTANHDEIVKHQAELMTKLGMDDAAKKDAIFAKTIDSLKAKITRASGQVVPGSPTQLKQAAAAPPPAPAAAAPKAGAAPAIPGAAPAPASVPVPATPAK